MESSELVDSGGLPFIRGGDVAEGHISFDDADYIDEELRDSFGNKVSQEGDVVITTKGSVGRFAFVRPAYPEFVYSPQLSFWRVEDTSEILPGYLWQWVRSPELRKQLGMYKGQTTMADYISLEDQHRIEIDLPSLPIQRRIADILGALDDKIELNRRMNETLEEMAQALYRHWFVDFRPFQDREFKDTEELRPIPEGWDVKPIKEVVDMLGGSTPKTKVDKYWDDGNVTWFTPTDLTDQDQLFLEHSDRQITEEGLSSCSTNLFPPYSIMMTSRATVGVTAINRVEACTNQGFINIIPEDEVSLPQVYFWIDRMMHKIKARADGSTYPEISQRDFKPLPILVAPSEDVEEYVRQSEELFSLIENNIVESETLAETRDYLLPKLISGEIEVDAAERKVGEVAEAGDVPTS